MSYPGVRPIPKRIRYVFPNGYKEEGRIVDRVRLRSSSKGGNYLMVIEKILGQVGKSLQYGLVITERKGIRRSGAGEAKLPSILEKAKWKGFSVWQLPRDFSIYNCPPFVRELSPAEVRHTLSSHAKQPGL